MGVPWAVYRYQIKEGTQHTRAVCGSHNRAGRVEARLKMVGTVVCRASDHARHVFVVTVIYSHIIIASFILGQYQIQNMDFKYHTAINNGDYKYINHHCPIYIYHGSQ